MDTSSLTSLSPTVKEVNTKKKFFGVYLYKALVFAPGCLIVNRAKEHETAKELLQSRIETLRYRKFFATDARAMFLENYAKADQIQYFLDVKKQYKDEIKIRVEEPNISVYSNNRDLLLEIASTAYPDRFTEFHRPRNAAEEEFLNNGCIVTAQAEEFSHRVYLKERIFPNADIKNSLGNYLYGMQNDIKISKKMLSSLNSNNSYFRGGYFYCNDIKVVTFINLIDPNAVAGIFKLHRPEI